MRSKSSFNLACTRSVGQPTQEVALRAPLDTLSQDIGITLQSTSILTQDPADVAQGEAHAFNTPALNIFILSKRKRGYE